MPADKTWPWEKSKLNVETFNRFERAKYKNGVETGLGVLANGTLQAGAFVVNGYHWVEDSDVISAFDFSSLLNQPSQETRKLYAQYNYTATDPHANVVYGYATTLPSNAIQLGVITVPASSVSITQGMISTADGSRDLSNRYLSEHAIIDSDTRIPTQGQKDALSGISNPPSSSNRFATQADLPVVSGDNLGNHTASQNINFNNFKGVNCAAPVSSSDVANKQFVLDNVGGQNLASSISQLRKHMMEMQLVVEGITNSPYPDNFGQPFFRTEFEEIGNYVEIDGKQVLQSDHDLTKLSADIITNKRSERGRIDTRLQLPKQYYFGEVVRHAQVPDIANKPHCITYCPEDLKIYMITRGDGVNDTVLHRINLISLQVEASWFFDETTFSRWNGIASGITYGNGRLYIMEYDTVNKDAVCIRFKVDALPPQGTRITKSNVGAVESAGCLEGSNGDIFTDIAYDSVNNLIWAMRKTGTSSHRLVRVKVDFVENGALAYDANSYNTSSVDTSINGIDFDPQTGLLWCVGDSWIARIHPTTIAITAKFKSYGKTGVCYVSDSNLPSVKGQLFNTDKTDVKMWVVALRNTLSLPASANYKPIHATAIIQGVNNTTKIVTLTKLDGSNSSFVSNEFKDMHMRVGNVYWNIASNTASTVTLDTQLDISSLSGKVELGTICKNFTTTLTTKGMKVWSYEGGVDNTTATSAGFMLTRNTEIGGVGIELGTVTTQGNIEMRIETDTNGAPSGTLAHANATTTISSGSLVASSWNTKSFANAFTLNKDTIYHFKIVNGATCQIKGHNNGFNDFQVGTNTINVRIYNNAKLEMNAISDVAVHNNRLYTSYIQSPGTDEVKPDGTTSTDTYINEADPNALYTSSNVLRVACTGLSDTWKTVAYAVLSTNSEPYSISTGVNDKLAIKVDGGTAQTFTLTSGSRTAAQIVADLAGLAGATASNVSGKVKIVSLASGGSIGFEAIANGAYATIGFTVGGSPTVPGSRWGATTGLNGSKIYVHAGATTIHVNDFWEYDIITGIWTSRAAGATTRKDAAGVVYNNKFFVYGGSYLNGTVLNDLTECDLSTFVWTARGTSVARSGHTSVVYNGKMYTCGGGSNTLYECNLSTYAWTNKGTPPMGNRNNHSAVVYNGKMYVFGGHDGTNYTNDLWECDLTTFVWTQKTSGASVRGGHSAVLNGSKMYVFNGYSGPDWNQSLPDVWECDLTTFVWTQKTSIGSYQNSRMDASVVAYDGKMYVFGGGNGYFGTPYNGFYMYTMSDANVYKARGILKFDLSSLPPTAVTATLSLYLDSANVSSKTVSIHRLTESVDIVGTSWNKRTAATNWTTAGGYYFGTPVASQTVTNGVGYVSFDITNLYNAWKAGTYTNEGVIIKLADEVTPGGYVYFGAADNASASKRPKLTVVSNPVSYNVGILTRDMIVNSGYSGNVTQAMEIVESKMYLALDKELRVIDLSDNSLMQVINNNSYPGITSTVIKGIAAKELIVDALAQRIHQYLVVCCDNGVSVLNMTTGTSFPIYNYEINSNNAVCEKVGVTDDGKLIILTETSPDVYQIDIFGDITKIYTSNTNKTWEQQTGIRITLRGPSGSGILSSDLITAMDAVVRLDNLEGYDNNLILIANGSNLVEYNVKTGKIMTIDTVPGYTCYDVAYSGDTINAIYSDGVSNGIYKQYDTYLKRLNYSIGKSGSTYSRLQFEDWNLKALKILENKVVVITTAAGVELVDLTYRDTNAFSSANWYSNKLHDANGIARATVMMKDFRMPREIAGLSSAAAKGAISVALNFGNLGAMVSAGDVLYLYSTSLTSSGNGEALLVDSSYNETSNTIPLATTTLAENIDESSTVIELSSQSVVDGLPVQGVIKIGSEQSLYNGKAGANVLVVSRGINGTTAASHLLGDTVNTVLRFDYQSGDEVVFLVDKKRINNLLDVRVMESNDGVTWTEGSQVLVSDVNTGYCAEAVRSDLPYGQLKISLKRTDYRGDTVAISSASMYWENY